MQAGLSVWCALLQAMGKACCNLDPHQRPIFKELVDRLAHLLSCCHSTGSQIGNDISLQPLALECS